MKKIGFIGCGKMASAIINGLIKSGFSLPSDIIATQLSLEGLEQKSSELGVEIIVDNKILAEQSEAIFLAVKPSQVVSVLEEIKPFVTSEKLIVSIAAGVNIKKIENNLPPFARVVRVMPNTPVLVEEGMSGVFGGTNSGKEDLKFVSNLFSAIGKSIVVENEAQLDIVTAISGSGPAFFYKMINDIARAGENLGLDYEKALLLSIQTAIGSAKMALNSRVDMETLISNVATKGGCTRVGVDVMEAKNIDKILQEVISKTAEKASDLGK